MKHIKTFESFSTEEIEGKPVYSEKCADCNCNCDSCDCDNCDCKECCGKCNITERKKNTETVGLTAKQKKLPPALQAGILKRLGKKAPKSKDDDSDNKKDDKKKTGLSAKQKKLPIALQNAILKRQK